ncbi:MAG: hypothetical protein LBT40_14590 [Deltaproteobacteria bacterium]|nr:hypothetical protein [Deltaproteobacteria bacterium]
MAVPARLLTKRPLATATPEPILTGRAPAEAEGAGRLRTEEALTGPPPATAEGPGRLLADEALTGPPPAAA